MRREISNTRLVFNCIVLTPLVVVYGITKLVIKLSEVVPSKK
jgi:hypothetical protein